MFTKCKEQGLSAIFKCHNWHQNPAKKTKLLPSATENLTTIVLIALINFETRFCLKNWQQISNSQGDPFFSKILP